MTAAPTASAARGRPRRRPAARAVKSSPHLSLHHSRASRAMMDVPSIAAALVIRTTCPGRAARLSRNLLTSPAIAPETTGLVTAEENSV